MGIVRTLLTALLTAATSIALAYSLFGLGFAACTAPQATSFIGGTFSGWEHSTFPEEDMAAIAEEVRSFSIEGTPSDQLYNTIYQAISEAQPALAQTLDAGSLADAGIGALPGETKGLAETLEQYSLPDDALSHLKDCTPIFTTGRISVGVVGAFGVAGLVALALIAGRKRAGGALMAAAALVIGVIVALGAWAVIDFNGLFTWMHSLLFAQGSWLFDPDSLLIRLFPEAFWAAMAALWVLTSLICALLAGLIGKILAH